MEPFTGPVAIYARYSSARQDERSIEDQVHRCREYVRRERPGDHSFEVFTDYAVSGASLNRKGFEAMMTAVESGGVCAIVTEDMSRISRDFADAAQIFKRLQYARVPLIGVADGIDTSAKHAKLTYTLKSLVADLYLDDLRDKTMRGLESRARAGMATGLVPYGFRTVAAHGSTGRRILIRDDRARIVRRIFEEYAAGRSMTVIARTLNREGVDSPRIGTRHRFAGWAIGTLHVMLRNERYIGVWRFKQKQWIKVPSSNKRRPRARPEGDAIVNERLDLRIIDLPLWEAVQARLAHNRGRRGHRSRYLLSGLFVCAHCGFSMTIAGGSTASNTYYVCATHRTKGLCNNAATVREAPLRRAVLDAIRRAITRNPAFSRALAAHGDGERAVRARARQAELSSIEQQIQRLLALVAAGRHEPSARVASAIAALERRARTEQAALAQLAPVTSVSQRATTVEDLAAAVGSVRKASHEEIEVAKERMRLWLAGTPMRFDGQAVEIALSATALVSEVVGDPAPPTGTVGDAPLRLRVDVTGFMTRPRRRPFAGKPRVRRRIASSERGLP